jgi:O-antigen ligase
MSERRLYIYYFFMLIVLCSWVSPTSAPPMPLRLVYLLALVLPAILKAPNMLVPVLACFTALGTYGISCSYMPTEKWIYLLIIAASLFIVPSRLKSCQRPPIIFVVFCIYVCFIDFIHGEELTNIDYCLLVVLLSFFFVSKNGYERNSYMIAFMITTIILSIFFFTYGQSSAIEVSETGRRSWVDPNYFGNVCGMGVVLAYNIVVNKLAPNKFFNKIAIFTIPLGMLLLVMNASRGAFLSMGVAIVVITMFSKIKFKQKIGIAVLVALGVFAMYSLGAFDVLSERLMDEDDTGNGRTLIWEAKMLGYMSGDTYEKLFGIGYQGGFFLAIPGGFGFHNDYLAFLVDYGIVGTSLFFCIIAYPLKLVANNPAKRPIVISLLAFILICSMTLEPFTYGILTYWFFYMLIVLYARWDNKSTSKQ